MGRRARYDGRAPGSAFAGAPANGNGCGSSAVAYDRVHDWSYVVHSCDDYDDGTDWDLRGIFMRWDGVRLTSESIIADTAANEPVAQVAFPAASEKWLATRPAGTSPPKIRVRLVGSPTADAITIADSGASSDVPWQPWGDDFRVAHHRNRDSFGKLVSANGVIGCETTIAVWSTCEQLSRVASCKSHQFLVVWQNGADDSAFDTDAYDRFLLGNGGFWLDPLQCAWSVYRDEAPDVTCLHGGIDYWVALDQERDPWPASPPGELDAARVRSTGVVSPSFVAKPPSGAAFDRSAAVAGARISRPVAADGWMDPVADNVDIYGRVAWQLFGDSFEWGSTSAWGSHVP